MHSKYPPISIVWLKRDLRLEDHEALCSALNSNNKVLLLYVAENTLKKNSHFYLMNLLKTGEIENFLS